MNLISRSIVILISGLASLSHGAGFQTAADNIYNEMANFTAPGKYETQSRYGWQGGHYVYKNKIQSVNLMNLSLPSSRGSCNGIDIYGGSFSFINEDQLVNFMKSVASNAKGYAFQLAMEQMCPSCVNWMNNLQEKVQKLNEHFSDSCQMAQGLVQGGMDALMNKESNKASLTGTLQGIGNDFASLAAHIGDSRSAFERLWGSNPNIAQGERGSITAKALSQSSAQSWFSGADMLLIEQIISYTGHTVVGDLINAPDGGRVPDLRLLPKLQGISLEMILNGTPAGTTVRIYNCSADPNNNTNRCDIRLTDTKTTTFEGLVPKLQTVLSGNSSLIARVESQNFMSQMSSEYKNVISSLPNSYGTLYQQITNKSPEAAKFFVDHTAPSIALEFVYKLMKESLYATRDAVNRSSSAFKTQDLENIANALAELERERSELIGKYGEPQKVIGYYAEIMRVLPSPSYSDGSQLIQTNVSN